MSQLWEILIDEEIILCVTMNLTKLYSCLLTLCQLDGHDALIVANLDLCLDLTQIQTLLAQLGVSLDFGGIELFGDNPRIFELR